MIRKTTDAVSTLSHGLAAEPPANVRPGIPSETWRREELFVRADWENDRIKKRKNDAPNYWFLGKALLLVRREFDRGEWTAWRKTHEIDRSRSQRSQLLALAFVSPDELAGLSVSRAVKLAGRRLGRQPARSAAEGRILRRLRQWKKNALPAALRDLDDVLAPRRFLPLIDEIAELLETLRQHAQRTAARSPASGNLAAANKRRSGSPA